MSYDHQYDQYKTQEMRGKVILWSCEILRRFITDC